MPCCCVCVYYIYAGEGPGDEGVSFTERDERAAESAGTPPPLAFVILIITGIDRQLVSLM